MAAPIIKIKRGTTVPGPNALQAGEFAIDQAAKNLYLGIDDGAGNITNEVVGGEGTFATKAYVTTAVNGVSGTLGDMAQQYKNAVNITGGTIDGTTIGATTPSTGAFTTLTASTLSGTINALNSTLEFANLSSPIISGAMIGSGTTIDDSEIGLITPRAGAFTTLTASNPPSALTDVVRKTDLDTAIGALGSVFHYVGDVSSATTPLDLTTLSDQATGAYYKVDADGAYTDGTTTFNAKVGDAFVKTTTGWQKLDNVDAVVIGTANEIAVIGDENTGYGVSIDPIFSGRVSNVEDKTQHITATPITTGLPNSGLTSIVGGFEAGAPLGGSVIKVDRNNGLALELNELGNPTSKIHATLELVDSGWGLPTGAGGGYSIKADGRIMTSAGGLDVTGDSTLNGNLSVTGNITDAIIDGGVY